MSKEEDNNIKEEKKKTKDSGSSSSSSDDKLSPPERVDAKGYLDSYSNQKNTKKSDNDDEIPRLKDLNKPHKNYIDDKSNKTSSYSNEEELGYEEYEEPSDSLLITDMISEDKSTKNVKISLFDDKNKNLAMFLIIIFIPIMLLLLIIIIINGKNPLSSIGSNGEENESIKELKNKISEVKSSFTSEYGVSIDEKLILATLIAYQDNDKYSSEDMDVSKIELLAKYQIITKTKCNYDSSTIRKIASNDKKVLFGSEEKNYKCDSSSKEETYETSTERGDYSDDNSGGVYYWNLIDGDFITDYYSDFVYSEGSNQKKDEKKIHSIVEDIYDFYEIMPDDESTDNTCGIVYAECPGVTVNGYGTYDLETYVTGVLNAEFGVLGDSEEMMKAAAIAIRSFTLGRTNNCSQSIASSEGAQVFSNSSKYAQIAKDTEGVVLTYNDKVITAPYSALDKQHCDSIYMDNGVKTCKVKNETWFGSGKYYEITVPYSALPDYVGGYHHTGMAVWAVYYYAKQKGYKADQLLKMSYGEDIKLSRLSGSAGSANNTCGNSEYVSSDGIKFEAKHYDIAGTTEGLGSAFNFGASNVSQCPWYAKYRAIEIVGSSSLSSDLKEKAKAVLLAASGNGRDWYGGTNSTLSYFEYSNDVTKPKPGALIAWDKYAHDYGHVAIIEKVNADGTVVISEGWNRFGADSGNSINSIRIWTRTLTIDQIKTYLGTGKFIGYTYLLSHKK